MVDFDPTNPYVNPSKQARGPSDASSPARKSSLPPQRKVTTDYYGSQGERDRSSYSGNGSRLSNIDPYASSQTTSVTLSNGQIIDAEMLNLLAELFYWCQVSYQGKLPTYSKEHNEWVNGKRRDMPSLPKREYERSGLGSVEFKDGVGYVFKIKKDGKEVEFIASDIFHKNDGYAGSSKSGFKNEIVAFVIDGKFISLDGKELKVTHNNGKVVFSKDESRFVEISGNQISKVKKILGDKKIEEQTKLDEKVAST